MELYRTNANDNPFHSQIRFRQMLWDFYFLYLKFQKNETPVVNIMYWQFPYSVRVNRLWSEF